jgi:hypothetical protein
VINKPAPVRLLLAPVSLFGAGSSLTGRPVSHGDAYSLMTPVQNGGNKPVEKAQIMALASDAAVVVHRVRITSRQLGRQRYTQPAQITGDSCADVGNVLQTSNVSPLA